MSIEFTVESVNEKPKKVNAHKERSSKYQPILDKFLNSEHSLVRVDGTGKEANYLASILKRLIKERGDSAIVSVRNREVYLENTGD